VPEQRRKRPREAAQLAKLMIDIAAKLKTERQRQKNKGKTQAV
jgi:hypothetical protein